MPFKLDGLMRYSPPYIVDSVCAFYEIPKQRVLKSGRLKPDEAKAAVAIASILREQGKTLQKIAEVLKKTDHTSA
ncbi:MAG: hypothetical protein AAFY41_00795, partial [Bacteroidota bacterium]